MWRDLDFRFFHESVSPRPLIIPMPRCFRKFAKIFAPTIHAFLNRSIRMLNHNSERYLLQILGTLPCIELRQASSPARPSIATARGTSRWCDLAFDLNHHHSVLGFVDDVCKLTSRNTLYVRDVIIYSYIHTRTRYCSTHEVGIKYYINLFF